MSFQMRIMRSRASRVPNAMISLRRSWTLVTRKKISVPKNTTNWPTAGVIGEHDRADHFGRVGFDRDGRPVRGGRHDGVLDVVQDRERISNTRSFSCTAAPISGARAIHSVSGAAKNVSSKPDHGDDS